MLHFVTTLDTAYVPGLLALLQSLKENAGCAFRFTILTYGKIPKPEVARLESLGVPLEWIPRSRLGKLPDPPNSEPRMRPNFQKPLIWRLPYEHPLTYIDTDVLCLRSLQGMEKFDELTVVRKQSSIGRSTDADSSYLPSGRYPWNAGIFVFRPSEETLQGIIEQANSYTSPIRYGDQVILNDHFNRERPEVLNYVGYEWNMSTWVARRYPRLFRRTPTRLLHFAHAAKPWKDPPEFDWQRPFWQLWQHFYDRAMQQSTPHSNG